MDELAFIILDTLLHKDENGRPDGLSIQPAKELFTAVAVPTEAGLGSFCEALKEMHIMSLVDVNGLIDAASVEQNRITVSVTEIGLKRYVEILGSKMRYI